MKKAILCLLFLGLLCTFALAEETIPNLLGNWEGNALMHRKDAGFKEGEAPCTFVVKEQEGRVFYGEKIWFVDGEEKKEEFSGVISIDNKHIYLAGHIDGFTIGDIVSEDEIVIYYVEAGEEAKVIINELDRAK